MLLTEIGSECFRFFCKTCPFIYNVREKITSTLKLERKNKLDDVLGAKEAWENVDKTEVVCPRCGHDTAFFMQLQIRSADEPMTSFYKCCGCSLQWREN